MKTKMFAKINFLAAAVLTAASAFAQTRQDSLDWSEAVGRDGTNRVVLPVNQVITPAGTQIELHGLRPQVLALSPDGKILVTSGKRAIWW